MKSTPRPSLIHSRTENGAARCAWTYSSAAAADTATERIEPNMRAFSELQKRLRCASGEPASQLLDRGDREQSPQFGQVACSSELSAQQC